jgi:tRNA uridine 5-carbamoylmethylation protein Kti12
MIPVLWLAGPPGVGKTAVAWEIYQRLQRAGRTRLTSTSISWESATLHPPRIQTDTH